MDSSLLLKEDELASIRKRNKSLIIIFFSLIIVLAVITGGAITSLVRQLNAESLKSNRAIQKFCSPTELRSACIDSLISAIKPPPDANPNHIFLLSLESSLSKITNTISTEQKLGSCSISLTHAASQLSNILEILRIDPDVESYDRGEMTAWIGAAAEDLAACADLGLGVADAAAAVGYGKDFLASCDAVNAQFAWWVGNYMSRIDVQGFENLMTVSLFGSQYLVLIFLFCLLLRIY